MSSKVCKIMLNFVKKSMFKRFFKETQAQNKLFAIKCTKKCVLDLFSDSIIFFHDDLIIISQKMLSIEREKKSE